MRGKKREKARREREEWLSLFYLLHRVHEKKGEIAQVPERERERERERVCHSLTCLLHRVQVSPEGAVLTVILWGVHVCIHLHLF